MADELTEALCGPRQLKALGSPAWCIQTVHYLKDHIRHVDEQWRQADQILTELITVRAWEKIPPEHPYGSLDAMLHANTGLYAREIRQRIREAELAARGRPKKGDVITFKSGHRGTSETYTIRRLRRDRPDLAALVEQGTLSANAAAIEAGFRARTKTVRLDDPASAARTLRIHMKPDSRRMLARLLLDDEEAPGI